MANKLDLIIKALGLLDEKTIDRIGKAAKDIVDGVKNTYGLIHKRAEAEVDGKKGFLIWDYILYNEISFQAEDGSSLSFFSSFSDEETEIEWYRLVKKYGV